MRWFCDCKEESIDREVGCPIQLHRLAGKTQKDNEAGIPYFIEIYMEDQSHRLRQHTMMNKRFLFDKHIIPYFGNKKVNAIKAPDIRAWQNKLMATDLKPTYLKTINNQLNAVFNYAMKYYDLKENPCRKAG